MQPIIEAASAPCLQALPRANRPARVTGRCPTPVSCRIGCVGGPLQKGPGGKDYFNEVLTVVNVVLNVVPRPFTAAMIASAMPAAIRPYSIAVAPASSDR